MIGSSLSIENPGATTAINQSAYKEPVRAATTGVLSATYSSLAQTLTATSDGAISVDGVSLALNERVLVKDQFAPSDSDNGIYDVTQVGDVGSPFILTRSSDFNQDTEVNPNVLVSISEGDDNADRIFQLTTDDPITIDTTGLVFEKYDALPTGNTLFVDSVLGNDSAAAVADASQPYLTLNAAVTAASSGDLIFVRPGTYVPTTNLAKDGVNWYLSEGVIINGTFGVAIFDTTGSPITFVVSGKGDLVGNSAQAIKHGSTSNVTYEVRDITATNSTGIRLDGGRVVIRARDIDYTGTGTGSAIVVDLAIDAFIEADRISHNGSVGGFTIIAIGTYAGQTIIKCPEINAPTAIADTSALNYHQSSLAASKIIIYGNIIDSRATNNGINANGNAAVDMQGGQLELYGNITADAYRAFLTRASTTGSARITGLITSNTDLDAAFIADSAAIDTFVKPGSEIEGTGTAATTVSIGEGITSVSAIVGNYLELAGKIVNTTAGSNAIQKGGASPSDTTLVINNLKVVAETGGGGVGVAIEAATPQDIKITSTFAGNVPISGTAAITNLIAGTTYTLDTDVE